MTIKITSNFHKREIVQAYRVPRDVWLDRFCAYRGEDQDQADGSYFVHRGYWYDLGEFMRSSGPDTCASCAALGRDPKPSDRCQYDHAPYWHGVSADSFSSGTVVRLCDDGERVIVGRCYQIG